MSTDTSKIKLGIRGLAGSLGTSIYCALPKQKDIELVLGVVRDDETLKRFLRRRHTLCDYPDQLALLDSFLPKVLLLDKDPPIKAPVSKNDVTLKPLNLEDLSSCAVILDCATPGTFRVWDTNYYSKLSGTFVLSQAGEFSCSGPLISPPIVPTTQDSNRIFRLGDCIVSALVPVISTLVNHFGLTDVSLAITTQFTDSVDGTPTSDVADAIHFSDAANPQKKRDLISLCKTDLDIVSYNQVIGLRFYDVKLKGKIKSSSLRDVRSSLLQVPRVRLANGISGTDDLISLRRSLLNIGLNLPPIVVSGCSGSGSADNLDFHVSIDHQSIAACANLDALRILACKLDPLVAMEITDYWMGYRKFDQISDFAKDYVKRFD